MRYANKNGVIFNNNPNFNIYSFVIGIANFIFIQNKNH